MKPKAPSNDFFRCKTLEHLEDEDKLNAESVGFRRHLGVWSLVLLGIGAIIGAGIFSLTGLAAGQAAGPAVVFSFMAAGSACALAGLCYAEFASMVPVAGSAYTYSYLTLGEFFAWIIGWDLILEYAVGSAAVASSWSAYLMRFLAQLKIPFPHEWATSPIPTMVKGVEVSGYVNLPAIFIIVAMSLVLIRGIRESAFFNSIMVGIKLTIVVSFIVLGWKYMVPANHHPFIPPNLGKFGEFGWSGILQGAGLVFFAYIGFDAVSTAAQEAKNPRRDIPLGVLLSLLICTVLYCLFSYVLTGLADYHEFQGPDRLAPVAIAIEHTPYKIFSELIEIAILAGFSSVILVLLLGQSRIFHSMSRDGLLPPIFSEIHPRFRTPWKSNILLAILGGALAGFVPAQMVAEMCNIGTLLAFVMVCVAVIILRRTRPNAPRKFRVPWVPVVPILGIISCCALMYGLPGETWIRLVVWLAIGLLIYVFYSRNRSKLNQA